MTKFVQRTKAPKKGEKFYSTQCPFAGGKYDMFDKHKEYQGNCTHYAYSRMSEVMGKKSGLPTCNAGKWYEETKFPKGKTPKVGAVIEFKHTKKSGGHVGYIEEIKPNGDLIASMSGWNTYLWKTRTLKKSKGYVYSDYELVGFIYCPFELEVKEHYKGEYPKLPTRGYFYYKYDKKKKKCVIVDKGAEVKKLQKLLNWANDCNLKVDGILGKDTDEQIRAYQKKYGLKVDGKFGKDCLNKAKAIKKY